MNSSEDLLRAVSQFWHMPVPAAMARLHLSTSVSKLGPCTFFSPEELLDAEIRWRGMLPQFLPIGMDPDENLYGFYAAPGDNRRDYPILWWNHEFDHYLPVASDFAAFLDSCVIIGRYHAQDADEGYSSEKELAECVRQLSLSPALMSQAPPRNERELTERLVKQDPQDALALARLGSMEMARGELQRARDFLVRSSEAAPTFSDPYFLLGETYRLEKNEPRACELWWKVFESPVAYCSRTGQYGLGSDSDDAEIYEMAAERSLACRDYLEDAILSSPLWRLLCTTDPFSSEARLGLGREYSRIGEPSAVEREYLNALTLATGEDELDAAYESLILFYESAGRDRDAELCRFDVLLESEEG